MKLRQWTGMALAALWIILNGFFVLHAKAETIPEDMDRMLPFSASVEFSPQGYVVVGTLAELPSDICSIQPLASTDGESWQVCPRNWNLLRWDSQDPEVLEKLRTQPCLNDIDEPFRSYLAGELDRFYVKLRLTGEDGDVRETEAAVIERGEPQSLPEELTPVAALDRSMLIREWVPSYREYGVYQLTVGEDAVGEDAAAYLPESLPVWIELYRGIDFVGGGTIDCPVVWKPMTIPEPAAGESVILSDAAEEMVVPEGTLLNTPIGIYRLEEPLYIASSGQFPHSDEIRLILDITAEQEDSGEPDPEEPDSGEPQTTENNVQPNGDGSANRPDQGGAGGNEGNAGTDNRGDSTEGGQRSNLPEEPASTGEVPKEENQVPASETGGGQNAPESPAGENQAQAPEKAPAKENQAQAPKTTPAKENQVPVSETGGGQNTPKGPAVEKQVPAPKKSSTKENQAQAPEEAPREENQIPASEAGDSQNTPENPAGEKQSQAPEAGGSAFRFTTAGLLIIGMTITGIMTACICITTFAGGRGRKVRSPQGNPW